MGLCDRHWTIMVRAKVEDVSMLALSSEGGEGLHEMTALCQAESA